MNKIYVDGIILIPIVMILRDHKKLRETVSLAYVYVKILRVNHRARKAIISFSKNLNNKIKLNIVVYRRTKVL